MKTTFADKNFATDARTDFRFNDLFEVEEMQQLQDLFSDAHGVASIITGPDGSPITRPSNFSRMCDNLVPLTKSGKTACLISQALTGMMAADSPVMHPCLVCGLYNASAPIIVGGKKIAHWLIGQIRNENWDEQQIEKCAGVIGTDKNEFLKAWKEVPVMSLEQFNKVSKVLNAFAGVLSEKAYNNLQLKIQLSRHEETIALLKESEENIRYIVRHDPNAIAVFDRNMHYLAVSERYLHDYEVKEKDIIGKHHYDVFPEMPQKWKEVHQRSLAGETISNEDDSFARPDGSITYNRWECRPWHQVNGEIGGIILYSEVTTERKKTEKALLESEIKYRAFFENSMDAILLTSPDGKTLSANQAACNLFGYSEAELKNIGRAGVVDLSDPRLEYMISERAKNQKVQCELTFIRRDGTRFPAEISSAIFKDSEGLERTSMIIRDITERRKIQNELKFQADLLNRVGQAIMATDLLGKVIYWNHAGETIYGLSTDDAKGRNIVDLTPTEQSRELAVEIMRGLRHGIKWSGEFNVRRRNGENFPAHVTMTPLADPNGTITGIVGISSDITDQKRTEQELIAAKNKAEEGDRLKSAFLANMSHEIRTPMNGILGFAGLLREPLLTGIEQQEYIGIIEKSGTRMLNIINDIISISKVESGQMELSVKPTNINEQLEFVHRFFKPEAAQKGIGLLVDYALPSSMSVIETDTEKVYAILTNLVKNAIKFTHRGIINFGYSLKEGGNGQELEFYVKDSGIGIEPEQQQYIFERFRQGNESLNRKYEGAGLGLTISRAYTIILGGRLWVESEPGKGSTFYFTLPYHRVNSGDTADLAEHSDVAEEIESDKLKILIAEDDEITRKLLSAILNTFAKEILMAKNGTEAVLICGNHPDIDLVLMDIKMPGMDGYTAVQQIRQFNPGVLIIAQTAFALEGDREKALAAGCNDYIAKPFSKSALLSVVQKHLDINQ